MSLGHWVNDFGQGRVESRISDPVFDF